MYIMTQQEGLSKEACLSFRGTQSRSIHLVEQVGFAG